MLSERAHCGRETGIRCWSRENLKFSKPKINFREGIGPESTALLMQ